MFKDGKQNNPFMSNDQKAVNKTYIAEKQSKLGVQNHNPTLFEFKINDTVVKYPDDKSGGIKEDPYKSMINQGIYPSPYVPVPNPFYPNIQNPLQPWSYQNNQIPIIKKYNISISNANGDLEKLHDLYEDVLPQVNGITQKTLVTLSERHIIYQYLRSIFIIHSDGEDINIGGGGKYPINGQRKELTNLLSHIKLMDINPYHFSRITNNPYTTIPDNFLMFRSCYPVRMNMQNNVVQCAQDNIGLNIRIYQMKIMDILANNLGSLLEKKDTDLWREIAYYEFIRENILKRKVSPNFVMIYAWYMTLKSGVDFDKLKRLKQERGGNIGNKNMINENIEISTKNIKNLIAKILIENGKDNNNELQIYPPLLIQSTLQPNTILNTEIKTSINLPNDVKKIDQNISSKDLENIDSNLNTNKCIVAITESPTNNLFDWGTRTYSIELGPIKRMVQTGFHDIKVWQSIIFQMLVALYVMADNMIAINELSIDNNIYIKDLAKDENNLGYWKYKIKGIDFYVPNYGYLVLIDTKYQEIVNGVENVDLNKIKNLKYNHKIFGNMFGDNDKLVKEKIKENFLNVFDVNNFNQGFTQYGGIKPPQDILKMISDINTQIRSSNGNISDIITNILLLTQNHFLHNRLGYIVKDIEKDQLVNDNIEFKPGDIVAHKFTGSAENAYTWALYLGKENKKINSDSNSDSDSDSDSDSSDIEDNKHYIYTVHHISLPDFKTPKLIKQIVQPGDMLRSYGVIEQSFKPNQKMAEEDILETYIISSQ